MKLTYPTEWSNEMRPVMSGISVIYPTGLDKIHYLDIGCFCKKSRNMSIFVFPCQHFGAYGFYISPPTQPPLFFFFF
jgi:hypothetical protein